VEHVAHFWQLVNRKCVSQVGGGGYIAGKWEKADEKKETFRKKNVSNGRAKRKMERKYKNIYVAPDAPGIYFSEKNALQTPFFIRSSWRYNLSSTIVSKVVLPYLKKNLRTVFGAY
jgi:hypothetical protein